MKPITTLILCSSLVLLTACGGSDSTTTDTGNTTTNTSTESNSGTTNTVVQKTADLVVAKDFNFDSSSMLEIDVDVSGKSAAQSHLSICKDYQANDAGGYEVNFDSCLIRTSLQNGLYQGKLNVTHDIEKLISVVLFMDDVQNPQYTEIDPTTGSMITIR